eukprot:4963514-Prymnesium_polylepis.1
MPNVLVMHQMWWKQPSKPGALGHSDGKGRHVNIVWDFLLAIGRRFRLTCRNMTAERYRTCVVGIILAESATTGSPPGQPWRSVYRLLTIWQALGGG